MILFNYWDFGHHMKKRANKFNSERVYFDYAFDAYGVAHQREINLLHKLKMGIVLTQPVVTSEMIRERIIARRTERKERQKQKILAAQSKGRLEQFVMSFVS